MATRTVKVRDNVFQDEELSLRLKTRGTNTVVDEFEGTISGNLRSWDVVDVASETYDFELVNVTVEAEADPADNGVRSYGVYDHEDEDGEHYIPEDDSGGGGGSPGGDGPLAHTHTVYLPGGSLPAVGVTLWVSQDSAGNNMLFGPVLTDENGQYTFGFENAGTYYVWAYKPGVVNFTNPATITVS